MAWERWIVRQASSCAAPNSCFLGRMPADRRGIKENVRAAEAGQARALRIPLVPANQHADAAKARVEIGEAEIARREIKLLVIERVVRDVHLAVDAEQRAIGIDDRGGVVIDAGGAALEERADDRRRSARARAFASASVDGPGNRLREIEQIRVFLAAEILRAEQVPAGR